MKFGRVVLDCEKVLFNNQQFKWMDALIHLRNYIDTANNDTLDCLRKQATSIGYGNKSACNYSAI